MDKKRVMYIGIILLVTVITSITYFSYAFFTKKDEYHGRLNIVAGELKYKLESTDLENNSIIIPANTTKEIEVEISSLNDINSEYSLYYDNSNVEIGYKEDSIDLPSGSITTGNKKKVTLIIKNKTSSSQTVTFGVKGGFSGKEVVLESNKLSIDEMINNCQYQPGEIWNFAYTASAQTFEVPCDGYYKIETWGASGGSSLNDTSNISVRGGYGAYTSGTIQLDDRKTVYVYTGEAGVVQANFQSYNGGGVTSSGAWRINDSSGGGATDVRLTSGNWYDSESLNSRIIVAAGGGGASIGYQYRYGGDAGGLIGNSGLPCVRSDCAGVVVASTGGTQEAGGAGSITTGSYPNTGGNGAFGMGGNSVYSAGWTGGSGGSGYYGGGGGSSHYSSSGAGGSSYISGHTGCVAITSSTNLLPKSGCTTGTSDIECSKHYSKLYFTDTKMIDGQGYSWTNVKGALEAMPNPSGGNYASGIGHTGNGYARITYLGD